MICWPVCWLLKASFFKQTKIVNWNFENHKSPPCFLKAQLFQALVKQGIEGAGKVMKQITSLTCSTRKTLRENEGGSGVGTGLSFFEFRSASMNETHEWSHPMIEHWVVFNTGGLVEQGEAFAKTKTRPNRIMSMLPNCAWYCRCVDWHQPFERILPMWNFEC